MTNITVEQCLNQSSCGEKLIAIIVSELKNMSNDFDNGESKKLKELYELGNKLITYNYYEEADKLESKMLSETNGEKMLAEMLVGDSSVSDVISARAHAKTEKKLDYIRFFDELGENIEEWC